MKRGPTLQCGKLAIKYPRIYWYLQLITSNYNIQDELHLRQCSIGFKVIICFRQINALRQCPHYKAVCQNNMTSRQANWTLSKDLSVRSTPLPKIHATMSKQRSTPKNSFHLLLSTCCRCERGLMLTIMSNLRAVQSATNWSWRQHIATVVSVACTKYQTFMMWFHVQLFHAVSQQVTEPSTRRQGTITFRRLPP